MIRIFQTIRCFFWQVKLRFTFKIKTIPTVIDAGDLCRVGYKVFVDQHGKLMFQSRSFVSEIHGACEWTVDTKKLLQISESKIVIDALVKPYTHVEE